MAPIKFAHRLDEGRAEHEPVEGFAVTHRIEVSLPVESFPIRNSMPFFRWLTECLREHGPFFHIDRWFPFLCRETFTRNSNDVTEVDHFEE